MSRILLTGASGFIGSHLLDHISCHDEVIALGRHRPEQHRNANLSWIEQDLADPLYVRRLPERVDIVVHLAQSQVYKEFPERAGEIFDVNVAGTVRLLDYARRSGVSRFIFASSGGVYRLSKSKVTESDPIQPLSFYLSSKYATEVLMRNYEAFFGTTILRLFFVYGPGQQPNMLIPGFMRKISRHEPITIEGNPGLRVNPIYVTDAARAIAAVIESATTGVFNVAGDEIVSITELVEQIATVRGIDANIRYTSTNSVGDLVADTSRMKNLIGISPEIHLREGLRRTVDSGHIGDSAC